MNFEAIVIGCLAGFVSAFFGIGGSSIDTPLLRTFLDMPPYLALATPLPTALLTITIALLTYWKNHLVNYRIFFWSVLGGLPGTILGAYLSHLFSGKTLMLFTAFVLFLVGMDFIGKSLRDRNKRKDKTKPHPVSAFFIVNVTFFLSIVSGILANGGGLFLIPAYVMLFKLPIKEAIATSLLTVAIIILPSTLIHYQLGHIDLATSAFMSLGIIPMAYIGAKMDLRTQSNTIQTLFGIMLLLFSFYFFFSQV